MAAPGAPWALEAPSKEPTPVPAPVDSEPARNHAPDALTRPSISAPELSRMHARLLLGWVADSDWSHPASSVDVVALDDGHPVLLASALLEIYREMCAEKGIAERPWNPVARELRALTGDRKGYAWVERNGVKHRLRVYRVNVGESLFAPSDAHEASGAAMRQSGSEGRSSLTAEGAKKARAA